VIGDSFYTLKDKHTNKWIIFIVQCIKTKFIVGSNLTSPANPTWHSKRMGITTRALDTHSYYNVKRVQLGKS